MVHQARFILLHAVCLLDHARADTVIMPRQAWDRKHFTRKTDAIWLHAHLDCRARQEAEGRGREGDAAGVREWLEAGADPNAPDPGNGWTAMHRAAVEGKSVEVLEVLRGARAEVDKATENGLTPLMVAASNDTTGDVVRWLLEQGADWRLQATSGEYAGETALGIAKRNNEAEAASVLEAWVSEHGSAEEAAAAAAAVVQEMKRGETHAAHSTPYCHVWPEPVLV
eukprot:COSAG06_NODE_3852_length_4829_cov_3.475899_4_plen_226_part_00